MNTFYTEASPTNVFTLVLDNGIDNFKIANADVNAKTIVITNPFLNAEVTIKLFYKAVATITYPTTITWKDSNAPIYTVGKIYYIYLITDDGGATYQGTWTGSW